jgi:tetratricopeptide (TPR) repeat protein
MDLEQIRIEAENAMRAGDRSRARSVLSRLKGRPVPRAKASTLATLARRAGLLALALKIMSPIIRPKVPLNRKSTDEEKATYAVILLGIGASNEALEILQRADQQDPEVNLAQAFCNINQWNYPNAIRYLNKYLSLNGPTAYQHMIAKVNLAASYVATGEIMQGKPLVEQIVSETAENGWHLLHKNALELGAQLAINSAEWGTASKYLSQASGGARAEFNLDDFFVRKWKAVLNLLREGPKTESLESLAQVRFDAVQRGHWETVRDCDYHRAIALKDQSLLEHVYFGTPFSNFHDRIQKNAGKWFDVPTRFIWKINGKPSDRTFNLNLAEENHGGAGMKPGQGLHVALRTLTSDLYKPFVLGSLHSAFFPNGYFNPESSPQRVAFLLHRLRAWMSDNKVPLAVAVSRQGYRLEAQGAYAFEFERRATRMPPGSPEPYRVMLDKVRRLKRRRDFSAAEISQHLNVSIRSARYFVSWAVENGKLRRLGTGRATRYKVGN